MFAVVVAVVCGVVADEVGLRVAATSGGPRRHKHIVADPVLHHRIHPNVTATVGGVPLTTNSLGLKDREIEVKKPSSVFRVLMLGDSFTEGIGLPTDQTPAKIAERLLTEMTQCRGHYEIVNAGVTSYSPILEYLWLKQLAPRLTPDLVVLNFDMTDFHDDWIRTSLARFDSHGLPVAVPANPIRERGLLMLPMPKAMVLGFLTPLEQTLSQSAVYQELRMSAAVQHVAGPARLGSGRLEPLGLIGDIQYDLMAFTRDEPPRRLREAWALTERYLAAISNLAAAHGSPFALVVYPWPHQVSATASPEGRLRFDLRPRLYASTRPFDLLEDFGRRHGVPVINLLALFRDAIRSEVRLFYEDDIHHTPQGARLLAQGIVTGLLKRELLTPCR